MTQNVQLNIPAIDNHKVKAINLQAEGDFLACMKACADNILDSKDKSLESDGELADLFEGIEDEMPESNIVDIFVPGFFIGTATPKNEKQRDISQEAPRGDRMAKGVQEKLGISEPVIKTDDKREKPLPNTNEAKRADVDPISKIDIKGIEAKSKVQTKPMHAVDVKGQEVHGARPAETDSKEPKDVKNDGGIYQQNTEGVLKNIHTGAKIVDNKGFESNMDLASKEIVHRVETMTEGERQTIKVNLYPEELGEMEIALSMEEGKLTGKITVQNSDIRQMFSDKLNELNQNLRDQNINVAKLEVGISTGHEGQQKGQERRGRYKAANKNVRLYGDVQFAANSAYESKAELNGINVLA